LQNNYTVVYRRRGGRRQRAWEQNIKHLSSMRRKKIMRSLQRYGEMIELYAPVRLYKKVGQRRGAEPITL